MRDDRGFTLVESLIAMAVGSVLAASSAALLVSSARAVAASDIETAATHRLQRAIEEWRSSSNLPMSGEDVTDPRLRVEWSAVPVSATTWQLTVRVTALRLQRPLSAAVVVSRPQP